MHPNPLPTVVLVHGAWADGSSWGRVIAALAPDEGETVADVFYRNPPHPQAPELKPDDEVWIWLPDNVFPAAFAQHATAQEHTVLAAVQRPIAVSCIQKPVPKPGWKDLPSWYLVAEEDRMINPATQEFMAGRMNAITRSHAVDHAPLISAPDVVTALLTEAATAATVPGRSPA